MAYASVSISISVILGTLVPMDKEQILCNTARALAVPNSHLRSPELLPPASQSHFVIPPGTRMGALTVTHVEIDPWRDAQGSSQGVDDTLTS